MLAYVSDEFKTSGISHKDGLEKSTKKITFLHCIFQNLIPADNKQHLEGILFDIVLVCSLPPGQPSNSLDGYRHLGELKALTQRNISIEEREERIQQDLEQNAKHLDARDSRSTVHAEMKSYSLGGGGILPWSLAVLASSPGALSSCVTTLPVRELARTTSISTHRSTWRCRCSS